MRRRNFLIGSIGLGVGGGTTFGTHTVRADHEDQGSITFQDQTTQGRLIVIEELTTDINATLAVRNQDSDVELYHSDINKGEYNNYEIELDQLLTDSAELSVSLYDEDGHGFARDLATVEVDESVERLDGMSPTLFESNPGEGFNYPYYLYAPARLKTGEKRPILVQPNNTGLSTDDFAKHKEDAKDRVNGGVSRRMADELSIPLLVPVFPRPQSDPVNWEHYVHALDTETMQIDSGPLERVDLQLRSMVEHAQEQLAELSYPTGEDIILNGYSAAGNFVNRFAALQPDIVNSVTAGGVNGTALLPIEEAEDQTLNYQIGVADLESLTGEAFNKSAWQNVSHFVFMGGEDENDTIPFDDAWSETQRQIALDVYGSDMQEERMPYCESVYENNGAAGEFKVYPNVGHRYTPGIEEALAAFHKRHVGTFHAGIELQPEIGAESVQVTASTSTNAKAGDYEVRVISEERGDLTVMPQTLSTDETFKGSVQLSSPLHTDEQITLAVLESGTMDLAEAHATDATSAKGRVTFESQPIGGETEIDVAYELADSYSAEESAHLRLDTQSGGAVVLSELSPGDNGSTTATLPDENGIPFAQDRELYLVIVDNDPVGADPVALEQTVIGAPDTIAVNLELTSDQVVMRDNPTEVTATIEGLGGSTDEAEIQLKVNDTQLESRTVSVRLHETTTVDFTFRTDGLDSNEIEPSVSLAGESASTTIVVADLPANGTGTESRPYEVSTGSELAYLTQELDANYVLTDDIDLASYTNFVIIGSNDDKFTGSFNGDGHVIRNLQIERFRDTFDGIGLFGSITGATIQDVEIRDADVTGGSFVGGGVGIANQTGTIAGVLVSGTVSGESNVGGIIGGTSTGNADSSSVELWQLGSTATVDGSSKVGGVVGQPSGDTIRESYALGSVTGDSAIGGIIGASFFGTTIKETFVAASLPDGSADPIIGSDQNASLNDVYWDIDATGKPSSDVGGTGLQTAAMQGSSAPSKMSGLDFEETWRTVTNPPGYPVLRRFGGGGLPTEPGEPSFTDVLGVIGAYNTGDSYNGVEVTFTDVLQVISAYNAG